MHEKATPANRYCSCVKQFPVSLHYACLLDRLCVPMKVAASKRMAHEHAHTFSSVHLALLKTLALYKKGLPLLLSVHEQGQTNHPRKLLRR